MTGPRGVLSGPTAPEPPLVVPEPTQDGSAPAGASLTLTRTGTGPKGQVVGVLTSPDGTFEMTATEAGWAELEAAVAAGRNPVVLKPPADTDTPEEIDS